MKTLQHNLAQQWSDRSTKILAILLGVVLLAFAGVYVRDRYFQPNEALIDRELQRLEDMVKQDPNNVRSRLAVADAYSAKGMYDQAVGQYNEALKLSANDVDALAGLATVYAKRKQDDKALETFQKVVDALGGSEYAGSDRRLNKVYYEMGVLYVNRKQYDQAIESLQKALAVDKGDADSLYMIGVAFLGKGEPDEAIAAFRFATAFVPDFVEAYQGMQKAYEKQGEKDKAAYAKAMIAVTSGRYDDAIKQLESVTKALPDFADGWFGLGIAYELTGQKAKAIPAYQKVLALDPDQRLAKDRLRVLGQQ